VVEAQLRDALAWLAPLFAEPASHSQNGAALHAEG